MADVGLGIRGGWTRNDAISQRGNKTTKKWERRSIMRKVWLIFTLFASVVMLVAFPCFAVGAHAQTTAPEKVWELSIAHHVGVKHHLHINAWQPLADEINRESKGRIKATVFPGAALGKPDAELDLCQKGAIDIAMIYPIYTPSRFPLSDVVSLPFAIPSAEVGLKVVGKLIEKKLLDPALTDRVIGLWGTTSPYQFFLGKKTTKYEELKGLRLRSPGGLMTKSLEALGAVPMAVPGAEFQNAFERGVIDGGVVDYGSGPGYKLEEYTKQVIIANMGVTMNGVVMNKAKYDSLPKDLQKVIDSAMRNFMKNNADSFDMADKESSKVFEKAGIPIYHLTAAEKARWMKATESVYSNWLKDTKQKGLPADETYQEFKRLMKEYGTELPL
jgi:TRAP-type transport system periplasmic protein